MGKLFLAIGISGSGKSFTGKLMKKIDNDAIDNKADGKQYIKRYMALKNFDYAKI